MLDAMRLLANYTQQGELLMASQPALLQWGKLYSFLVDPVASTVVVRIDL